MFNPNSRAHVVCRRHEGERTLLGVTLPIPRAQAARSVTPPRSTFARGPFGSTLFTNATPTIACAAICHLPQGDWALAVSSPCTCEEARIDALKARAPPASALARCYLRLCFQQHAAAHDLEVGGVVASPG